MLAFRYPYAGEGQHRIARLLVLSTVFANSFQARPSHLNVFYDAAVFTLCYGLLICSPRIEDLHTASTQESLLALGICYLVSWFYQDRTFTCKHLQAYLGTKRRNTRWGKKHYNKMNLFMNNGSKTYCFWNYYFIIYSYHRDYFIYLFGLY